MKRIIIILLFLNTLLVHAQVGINLNPLPSEAFRVDSKANNATAPLSTAYLDDVVVDDRGNLGIGINVPQAKLDVKTTNQGQVFRLVDGNQKLGRVLLTNNNGTAGWADPQNTVMYAKCPVSMDGIKPKEYNVVGEYSGRYLTLTKGSWLVKYSINWGFNAVAIDQVGFIDVYLAKNTTGTPIIVDGTWVITPMYKNAVYGSSQNSIIYTVTANSETLYMWTYFNQVTHSYLESLSGANTFEAIRWE